MDQDLASSHPCREPVKVAGPKSFIERNSYTACGEPGVGWTHIDLMRGDHGVSCAAHGGHSGSERKPPPLTAEDWENM
jgi:hypothetical protein